jgi:ADP-ribose diphosphatase
MGKVELKKPVASMPTKPEILKRTLECESRLFRVESLDLRFSNGQERTFERLIGSGVPAVIVVPMLDDQRVILVREYGAGIHDYHVSLPKGRVDAGESLEEAADRELKEEAGYGARKLTLLKCLTQAPNYLSHRTQIVLAQDLYPEKLEGDEPEPLELEILHLNELPAWLERGDITEARTIAALYLARDYIAAQTA